MTDDSRVVAQLRGVAHKLTSDQELQKDLMQEMFVHLLRVTTAEPGKTKSWYVKSCEFQARNYLKHGRSIDSLKRAKGMVPLGEICENDDGEFIFTIDAADPVDWQREVEAKDIIDVLIARLTDTQRQIFSLLLKGFGVREIARQLGVSHPAVVKHRKRIALAAQTILIDKRPATLEAVFSAELAQVV